MLDLEPDPGFYCNQNTAKTLEINNKIKKNKSALDLNTIEEIFCYNLILFQFIKNRILYV